MGSKSLVAKLGALDDAQVRHLLTRIECSREQRAECDTLDRSCHPGCPAAQLLQSLRAASIVERGSE